MIITTAIKQEIIDATDQCVMCGLCLPHCPTYTAAKNEAESPRGRIALVRALYEDKLYPSQILTSHLDNCLTCMNCQTVCPAKVNYEKIIDAGREITRDQHTLAYKFKQALLLFALTKPSARSLVKNMLRIYHGLKIDYFLTKIAIKFPYALRIFKLVPKPKNTNSPKQVSSTITKNTRVILFNSCASDLFSDTVKVEAEHILQILNCEIVEVNQTPCCGALHQHTGHIKKAKALMQNFVESFANVDFDILISMATGCGAQLNHYPELLNDAVTTKLINKHMDINFFALQQLKKCKLEFKPLPKKVFIHKPCTQKNVTSDSRIVEQLLGKIPDIQLKLFQDELACCGAGGINTINQTKLADHLIGNKIAELKASNAAYLVTSNIGCALHFQAQLQDRDKTIIVCHPISLLVQQLLYSEHA